MNSRVEKTLIICAGVTLAFSIARAGTQWQVAWQRSFGGTNTDNLTSLQGTSDGGYVLGGTSNSGATGNKTSANYGDYDYWVIKLDAAGDKVWENSFGGTNTENLNSIQQANDGGYVLGGISFSGISGNKTNTWYGSADGWLLKLDAAGNKVWDQSFGGTSIDAINAVHTNSDGGYILAGTSTSGISGNKTSPNYGLTDFWLLKVDANGNKLWEQSFGGTFSDGALCLDVTRDGGYIIGGPASSGISGTKTSPGYGGSDYWVVKVDSSGNEQWENSFGGSLGDTLVKVLQTSDDGYILGGFSSSGVSGNKTSTNYGGSDFWVIKLDSSGNKVWENAFGGAGNEELRGLALAADGGYLLGGYSGSIVSGNKTSPNFGGADYWILKLDADGNKLWEQSFGGTSDDYLYALQETQDGGIILGGYSSSPVSGNKTSPQYGASDFWVIKLEMPRPELTIARLGQQLVLSWPSPSPGFVLEKNSNLATTNWTGAGATPVDDGTTKSVTVDATGSLFYRLRAQ